MKKLLVAFAIYLCALSAVPAQQIGSGKVWGNSTAATAPGQSVTVDDVITRKGSLIYTSTSTNCLTFGRQGSTSPAFSVDCSAATSATGLGVTSAASGGGVALQALSSGSNEKLTLAAKGTGSLILNGNTVSIDAAGSTPATINLGTINGGGVTVNIGGSGDGVAALNVYTAGGSQQTWVSGGGSTTVTFPAATDTLVGKATTDIFTNKTMAASSNVLGGVTMTLGSDATGDIYYRSGGVLTRLPIGTNGYVLQVNTGVPSWQPGSSAGSITVGSTSISSGTTNNILYNNAGTLANGTIVSFLTAGTGISISGTTNATINNTGVTSAAFVNGNGISIAVGAGANPCTTTCSLTVSTSLSTTSNALSGDVSITDTTNYFTGPSMAQGTTGTWYASGTVTLFSTTNDTFYCKLWDGTTVIASSVEYSGGSTTNRSMSLSGILASPAGNIRISCKNITTTNGKIVFNASGNSLDSKVTGMRIQ